MPKKPWRRHIGHPGKPSTQMLAPNDVWCADFKGQCKTGDGGYCSPLTAADGFGRYLLGCPALSSTAVAEAKPVFIRLFKEYGLPQRIRTDNGVPFATTTLARLSSLSAWWVRLGVLPELIETGKPQQNGRHERRHRTLKAEATRPAAGNLATPQRRFDRFREEYNLERPHEALDQETPASVYDRLDVRCRANCRRSNIRIVSRCAMLARTAAFAGTRAGSMSRSSVPGSMSAWKKSTKGSGLSLPLARGCLAGTNGVEYRLGQEPEGAKEAPT